MFIFNAFCLCVGIACTCVFFYGLVLMGDFQLGCPAVHGRVCNSPWGACQPDGTCACTVLTSGLACADNLIPGYSQVTGLACNGLGAAKPLIANLPASCNASEGPKYAARD